MQYVDFTEDPHLNFNLLYNCYLYASITQDSCKQGLEYSFSIRTPLPRPQCPLQGESTSFLNSKGTIWKLLSRGFRIWKTHNSLCFITVQEQNPAYEVFIHAYSLEIWTFSAARQYIHNPNDHLNFTSTWSLPHFLWAPKSSKFLCVQPCCEVTHFYCLLWNIVQSSLLIVWIHDLWHKWFPANKSPMTLKRALSKNTPKSMYCKNCTIFRALCK